MQNFKAFVVKHWLICMLLSGMMAGLALVNLPNLSQLAIQTAMPQSALTKQADQITGHWKPQLNHALPVTIKYSVPAEFSASQKVRLANKERFLIEHKADLKIYQVTSKYTSPHAQRLFNGKNWSKLELWIPQQLVNHPLYQAQLRHLCALPGIKTSWHNPINEQYQKLVDQWYQQKISCGWILVISFLILLLTTSLTTTILVTLANLEFSLIGLSLITNLTTTFYFYLPLLLTLLVCLITTSIMLFYNQPRWLSKLPHPLRAWHPFISLILLSFLIFPLVSNCQIHFQTSDGPQTVTVYLTSPKSVINQSSLAGLDHLTKTLQALPNVTQVTSLTQPGGKEIPKYQLGTQLDELQQNLTHQHQNTQATSAHLKQLGHEQTIPTLLPTQIPQLQQLQSAADAKDSFNQIIQQQATIQTELAQQTKHTKEALAEANTSLTDNQPDDELTNLDSLQKHTRQQFHLTKPDAQDSDFSQTCFNYNNQTQTATRLEITLRDGKLGKLPQLIKNQLVGTTFQSVIGLTGIPVLENTQQQHFKMQLPYLLGGLVVLSLLINGCKFKSLTFAVLLFSVVIIAGTASLGMLNYLTDYQFTPPLCYLLLTCLTYLTLLPNSKNAIFLTLIVALPFLLVASWRELGITLLTFSLIYQNFLFILLKIKQTKKPIFPNQLQQYLKNRLG